MKWLNGKKLIIGAVLFLIVKFTNEVIIGQFGYDTVLMGNIVYIVEWFATLEVTGGGIHKIVKVAKE